MRMDIPLDYICKDCKKGVNEVKFIINRQGDKTYILKRCNKCVYKRKKINKIKNRMKSKLKRIESIRKRIEIYFRESYSAE